MASAAFENDDSGGHPARQQQPTTLSNSSVTSVNNGSDSDDEKDLFELRLQLVVADRKNSDLERKLQRSQHAVAMVRASNRNLQQTNALNVAAASEAEALRAKVEALENSAAEKDSELKATRHDVTVAVQDAENTHARLRSSQDHNSRLERKVRSLESELSEANIRSNKAAMSQAEVDDLRTQLAQHSSQNRQYAQRVQMSTTDAERLKAQIDGQKRELDDVQAKLAAAESSRDWYVFQYPPSRLSIDPGDIQCVASAPRNPETAANSSKPPQELLIEFPFTEHVANMSTGTVMSTLRSWQSVTQSMPDVRPRSTA